MKNLLMGFMIVVAVSSCGAADGDPATDTTTMPRDTNIHVQDTSQINHLNRADGIKVGDTATGDSMHLRY